MPQFRFCSISWEPIGRISPNFIYAFILERSSFLIVTPFLSLICTRVMALYLCWNFIFPSISWELTVILSPNFIYAFILIRSSLGLLHVIFGIFIPPANFVCRGYTVFTLFVLPSVRPSVRLSVTLCFLNNSKIHFWIFIKPCKHVHICKTNTLDKKVRARGQFY